MERTFFVANELQGKKIAILLAPVGSEQVEFTEPKKAVEAEGATVDVIGMETGDAQTMNSDVNPGETFTVEKTFRAAPSARTRCVPTRTPSTSSTLSSSRPSPSA
jgi:putative intracellular protease/amidase